MAQIRKGGKKEVPGVNTSSLPDIVFMLLFFFMATTTMKEVSFKVDVKVPEATELQKLEKKSLTRYIYIGTPMKEYQKMYGTESRIQLDDAFAEVDEIEMFIENERGDMSEEDKGLLTVSIKADKDTKMGVVSDVKQALRRAQALKINYAATKKAPKRCFCLTSANLCVVLLSVLQFFNRVFAFFKTIILTKSVDKFFNYQMACNIAW